MKRYVYIFYVIILVGAFFVHAMEEMSEPSSLWLRLQVLDKKDPAEVDRDKKLISHHFLKSAGIFYLKGSYKNALHYYQLAQQSAYKIDQDTVAIAYAQQANCILDQEDTPNLDLAKYYIDLAKKANSYSALAESCVFFAQGRMHWFEGNIDEARSSFLATLNYCQECDILYLPLLGWLGKCAPSQRADEIDEDKCENGKEEIQ